MKKILSLLGVLVLLIGLAQDEVNEERLISIEMNGGNQSGNIRYGPINYEHPEPDGVVATVSTLTIFSSSAQLRGPETEGEERITLADAQGQRTATFTGGVNVERGRLSATGPDLFYTEAEGLGTLEGGTEIVVAPRQDAAAPAEDAPTEAADPEESEAIDGADADEPADEAEVSDEAAATEEPVEEAEASEETETSEDAGLEDTSEDAAPSDVAQGEPVFITANEVEFDVDTDVSISRGGVSLVNGNQTAEAEQIEYEEERTLGVLTNEGGQVTVTRVDEDGNELTITADEIRAETDSKTLYAVGNAVVVDGGITTTGSEVFFNDEEQLAEISGDPAESVDADGGTVRAPRIQQDIEFDVVEPMNTAQESGFSADDFLLTRETTE